MLLGLILQKLLLNLPKLNSSALYKCNRKTNIYSIVTNYVKVRHRLYRNGYGSWFKKQYSKGGRHWYHLNRLKYIRMFLGQFKGPSLFKLQKKTVSALRDKKAEVST